MELLYQLSYNGRDNNYHYCGGGRIRTYVGLRPTDLQSVVIDHSTTPPFFFKNPLLANLLEPAEGFGFASQSLPLISD